MRTTVTLDPDVHALLRDAAHRSGKPFKTALNDAIRNGLKPRAPAATEPPRWLCADLGVPLVDLTKAAALADELDDADRLAKAAPRAPAVRRR
ncbi:MAG: hypothetical protein QM750_15615 [Rubrivivax sp.]